MSPSLLQDIESRIDQLSTGEKQILLDRLAHDLRVTRGVNAELAASVACMARDPDIQREIRDIEKELADAAEDGLESPHG